MHEDLHGEWMVVTKKKKNWKERFKDKKKDVGSGLNDTLPTLTPISHAKKRPTAFNVEKAEPTKENKLQLGFIISPIRKWVKKKRACKEASLSPFS